METRVKLKGFEVMPKKVLKLNLSDHTLDINIRKCNYDKFDFSEIEDYVNALTGSREYQYEAIKKAMIYLWGGSYNDITQLAKENWKKKPAIQERFQSEENFLRRIPLPDRSSGVIHMATGTGKSYVIFAIAFLSIILGKVKRVLVLGPSSTVIESGLTGKFKEYLYGKNGLELKKKLPQKYQNVHVNLLNDNEPVSDNSIVIENINSIYNKDRNSIGDTLFAGTEDVLVLSDEVHHAYSHLTYTGNTIALDGDGGTGNIRDERLWMKFIREEPKIKRHIGFTGTPYNQDEYFCDVIYDYSIKDAMDGKFIKKIDPIIKTESDDGDVNLTTVQKFEQILITHQKNKDIYSYKIKGKPAFKPITIFINDKQTTAQKNTQEFIEVLASYIKNNQKKYSSMTESQLRQIATEKVICVISNPSDNDYQEKLERIEEIDPGKPGGKVEFVFAVNKLSEGWDVDNVYQIVPMEERVFDSKLLISQVLGRGLRLPRNVPQALILQNYPVVTITNHEKFADHIKELVYAVTQCETKFISKVFESDTFDRFKYHFQLFNLEYNPATQIIDSTEKKTQSINRELLLTPSKEKLGLNVTYLNSERRFELKKNYYTVDQLASEISERFAMRQFESKHFDFGGGFVLDELPEYEDIEKLILSTMEKAGIEGRKLSEDNRKAIDLYFNQFLPRGSRKRIITQIEGDINPISTQNMDSSSIRSGEVMHHRSVFISEDYLNELNEENLFVIKELETKFNDIYKKSISQLDLFSVIPIANENIREFIKLHRIYAVNTSIFKTPLNIVIVSHDPERDFVFKLIGHSKYYDSWVKSRDMGFYSLDYEYWKGGKDRTRKSFNPDFFIKINLERYIRCLETESVLNLPKFHSLQDKGVKEIVMAVEIKSDDDQEEVTRAKEKAGNEHFKLVNKRLLEINNFDLPEEFQESTSQHYVFELLRPEFYNNWFSNLKTGNISLYNQFL